YWLKDLIPGATDVVEIEGGRLFFPDERSEELVRSLRQHWAARACAASQSRRKTERWPSGSNVTTISVSCCAVTVATRPFGISVIFSSR
ncbi:MAG: hypothetical protein WAK76_23935, partial [Trebonia sp.]